MTKTCPPGKILNPKTNRCVKRDGKIGQKLRSRKRTKSPRVPKGCPPGKILNPKTNRCVKRDGKIGQTLRQRSRSRTPPLRKRSPQRSPFMKRSRTPPGRRNVDRPARRIIPGQVQKEAINYIQRRFGIDILDYIGDYTLLKPIGSGRNKNTFLLEKDGQEYVMKIQGGEPNRNNEYPEPLLYETDMMKEFRKYGLAPKLYKEIHLKTPLGDILSIVIMEKINGTLDNLLDAKHTKAELDQITDWLITIIDLMCKYNLVHGDFHNQNICYIIDPTKPPINKRPVLIDYGLSSSGPCEVNFDMSQLLRTLICIGPNGQECIGVRRYNHVDYCENVNYIRLRLTDYIKKKGLDQKLEDFTTCNEIDRTYFDKYDKYEKTFSKRQEEFVRRLNPSIFTEYYPMYSHRKK